MDKSINDIYPEKEPGSGLQRITGLENNIVANSITESQNIYKELINSTDKNSDSPWNYKILLLLKKIGKKTMGYRWMHEQETQYYDTMNTKFSVYEMLILAFMGTITGAGFINFIVSSGLDNNKIIYIVITIVQLLTIFLAAITTGYRNVNKYEKKNSDHFYAANKNSELNLSIQYQLSLNTEDRDTDKIFLKMVVKSFNDILFLSPPIREITKRKYLEESDDNDMFNPIITNKDGSLQIVINDSNNETNNISTDSKMEFLLAA